MDVKIIPLSGCMQLILGIFTLGVAPLAIWLQERKWPKSLDEQGLVTRSGKQIPWNEFTKIERVITTAGSGSGVTTERFELQSGQGNVYIVLHRLENGPEVLNYIWERLPVQAKPVQA
jgi:hypothetical protein